VSTTVNTLLGLVFLVLAIVAVLLQAWLWGPRFWDDIGKKTRAPKAWLRVHRVVGYTFAVIYVVMMWQMVPRLWRYQFELPARTVFHAVAAITLGVILVTKLSIIRFFRHFEEAMPKLGFGILLCAIILSVLSFPFSLRAHALNRSPENVRRVQRLLTELSLPGADVTKLSGARGLERGREVLTTRCVTCHDLRTILTKPRDAHSWYEVVQRMAEKPMVIGEPIEDSEIPFVTAYLIALTPSLQASVKLKAAGTEKQIAADKAILSMTTDAPVEAVDPKAAGALVESRCAECHDLDELDKHGGDDEPGWAKILNKMVVEEGARVTASEARTIVNFLIATRPKAAAASVKTP
jgi:mono/diheme cytochrome c family protein